jgi:AcrR family transcriptional regulator
MEALAATESASVLRWVRPPQQARTRESLNRLLDAAEKIVARKGFDETSIVEIARAAGSSVGGFYRRFRDKDGLLHALHERFCQEARATAEDVLDPARWRGAPAQQIVTEFTAFLVEVYRERDGLLRAFLVRGMSDDTVRHRTDELFGDLSAGMIKLFSQRTDELSHPDPAVALPLSLRLVVGTLNHTIQLRPSMLDIHDDRLAAELSRAFLCYLGLRSQQGGPTPRTELSTTKSRRDTTR